MRIQGVMLICALSACGTSEAPSSPSGPEVAPQEVVPEEASTEVLAARTADAIEAEPGRADEILAEHGYDQASFEALLYEIASDPDRAAAYEAARE